MYKKKDPGNRDNFVLLPGPVSQSDLTIANSQNPLVRCVNALFRVRLRMSMVVASRRCERLTQGVLGKAFAGMLGKKIPSSVPGMTGFIG
ncbi:MAG: hypothetical protein PHN79_07620 [Methanoregula sp.]|nr:hypothetical protein [Methanoregula sp.]